MAKHVYPNADFCLIEPQEEMKKDLENFCHEYPGSFFILAGAGANNEHKILTLWEDTLGSSFLPMPNDEHIKNNKQRKVEIITIDRVIENKQKIPQLIKLDIQGFELEALKGASKTFGITEVFILEVSLFVFENKMPIFSDVVNFMNDKNYVVYDFPGFLRRPFDGALGQCDICFVKKNGFLRSSNQW
jgi:FkbM family methyltransferase